MTAICSVPGCGRPVVARGCCGSHHRALLRHPDRPLQPLRGANGRIGPEPLVACTIWLPPSVAADVRADPAGARWVLCKRAELRAKAEIDTDKRKAT